MKQAFVFFILFFLGCNKSTEIRNRVRGRWYFDDEDVYIKITQNRYIVKNDSPFPEDYKFIGDSTIVKGFEASLFPEKYWDTMQIIKLTDDTLILKGSDASLLILHKR